FFTLDVFTDRRFAGNPLAVVLGADMLSTDAMQRIAREFNLSETVFVMKPDQPAHSAKVRIFTPASEMPFAGHPTVGTAALLAELRAAEVGGGGTALVTLEEKIGLVRVGIRMAEGRATFAEFDAPKLPEDVGNVPARDALAAALGLLPSEIGFANHHTTRFSSGPAFTFIPVSSLEAIGRAAPNLAYWADAFGETNDGAFLYTAETMHAASNYHARMFAPTHGIMEDPATGSAVAGFGGVVAMFDQPPDGLHRRQVEQGLEMGRASFIALSVELRGGVLSGVRIGGHSMRVSQGRIDVEA
ncbi:MAG: PhzF family phenazine biosynthesis protein, partial [Hyphomicrobiaceae bacterium]